MAHGKGQKHSSSEDVAGRGGEPADGDLVGELTGQLASLRAEIRRMEQLAADGDSVAAATGRLDALRNEARWLASTVDRPGAGKPTLKPRAASPAPESGRAERLRARRRRGVTHVVQLDIWDHDLNALVAAGELSAADVGDSAKVADAVEDLFDRWLHGAATGARTAPAGDVAVPAARRPAPVGPAESDDDGDRRGAESRRAPGEVSNILGMIEGSPLDRRKATDRRQDSDRRFVTD